MAETATNNENVSRTKAREKYWSLHDYEGYECPDCGRGLDRVDRFEVHHIDENPFNNDDDNLIGLCRRCHVWRHMGKTLTAMDNQEWKDAFLEAGAGKNRKHWRRRQSSKFP